MDLLNGNDKAIARLGLATSLLAGASIALGGCRGTECYSADPDCFIDEMVMVEPVDESEPIELVKIDRFVLENKIEHPVCPGTLCGDTCVNTDVDPQNCGSCGIGCNGGTCLSGSCACVSPKVLCDGRCVDTDIDPDNCGNCANACDAGTGDFCSAGVCVPDCGASTQCDLSCVDPLTSVDHCGGCDNACQFGETCDMGACACPDPPPYECGCIDPANDAENCGSCGNACEADQTCKKGICVSPSAAPTGPLSILNQPVPMLFVDPSQLQPLTLRWHDDNGCKPAFCAQLCNDSLCSQSFMCAPGSASPTATTWRPYMGFLAETRSDGIRLALDVVPISAAGCPADVLDRLANGDPNEPTVGQGVRIQLKMGEDEVISALDSEKNCSAPSTVCTCSVRSCANSDGCWYELDGGRIDCGSDCDCVNTAGAVASACCGTP